jgi:FkbM family methyltransferase
MRLKEFAKKIVAKIIPEFSVQYGTLTIRGPLEDRGFLKALSRGEREPFMTKTLVDFVAHDTVFLDVGGHLGQYSLAVAEKLPRGSAGRVVVFEPHPRSRKYLKRNVLMNGVDDKVTVEEFCAAASTGTVLFYSDDLQSDYSSTVPNAAGSSSRTVVEVPAIPLDEYFAGKDYPTVVKIDVEGAELSVLEGMREIMKQKKPLLFIECNGPALKRSGSSAKDLLEVLARSYSKISIIDEATKSLVTVNQSSNLNDKCENLLCLP